MRRLYPLVRLSPAFRFGWLVVAMIGASYCALVLVAIARALWHQRPLDDGLLWFNPVEHDVLLVFVPMYAAVLLLDILFNGWRESSLYRLAIASTPSTFSDLAYTAFNFSGLARILGIIALFGVGEWIERRFSAGIGLNVAAQWSLWLELPALKLWTGFWNYWEHRAMHSKLMWSLHKSHHSAEEFTILTAEREHPIETALSTITGVLIPASLGFSLESVAILGLVSMAAGMLQHSNIASLAWLERVGVFSPSGHRIHHGLDPKFHGRNFGELLNVWDRVFGTYRAPMKGDSALPIGVVGMPGRHNTANPVREVALQTYDWLVCAARLLHPRSARS